MTSKLYQRQAIEEFLSKLPGDAPVAAIARSAAVQAELAAYESADVEAMLAQARYQTWGRRGIRATTFGIIIGAILLFPVEQVINGVPRMIVGGMQTLALAATFGATLLLSWLKPAGEWMSSRAEAERRRGKTFATILKAPAPSGADPKTVLTQKLALLQAAHVKDQLRYFERRAEQHKALASQFSPLRILGYLLVAGATLLGLAALAKQLGAALPQTVDALATALVIPDANRWQLGITTIASGVLAHATARTLMDEDERKATLYEITAQKLKILITRDLPKVEAAVSNGDGASLQKYFTDVRSILDQEHAVWSFVRPSDDDADDVG